MAGAKETPRQKLISLMYLVFITMLALNVSKEVLDGFGQMFEKIADANERVSESNNLLYENIEVNSLKKAVNGLATIVLLSKSKKSLMHFIIKLHKLRRRLLKSRN